MALNSGLKEKFTLRVTITEGSAKFLSEIFNYFDALGVSHLFFSPVSSPESFGVIKKIINFFTELLSEAVTLQDYSKINKISNFSTFLSRFLNEKLNHHFCPAGVNYFSVDTSGYAYLCHRFVGNKLFLLGEIFYGTNIANLSIRENEKLPVKCVKCWALNVCGGFGCYYENFLANGDGMKPADKVCYYIKKIVELSMLIYYFNDAFDDCNLKENINFI